LLAAGFLEGKRTSVSVVAAAVVVSRGEEQGQKKLVVREWRLLLFVSFFLFFSRVPLLFSVSLARILCVSSFLLVAKLVPLPLYCCRRSEFLHRFSFRFVSSRLDSGHQCRCSSSRVDSWSFCYTFWLCSFETLFQ
jgi:hypothetical protein